MLKTSVRKDKKYVRAGIQKHVSSLIRLTSGIKKTDICESTSFVLHIVCHSLMTKMCERVDVYDVIMSRAFLIS